MKKLSVLLMPLLMLTMASHYAYAQEVTINLNPGWTWVSYPCADTMDVTTALQSIPPLEGDVIKTQSSTAFFMNGQWMGPMQLLIPGKGLMYKSNSTEPVTLTFQVHGSAPQGVVSTLEPTDISAASAVTGGTVTLDEGSHVFVRGVCWSTEQMPTVDDNHTSDGTGTGTFSTLLIGLTPITTYYVRAYAVTDYGLSYGEEMSFTTLDNGGSGNAPEGAIGGLFTINANGNQVYFSQGNLQYRAIDSLWRFAENQYDCIGNDNRYISSAYSGWIDLFGWGASGYDHGANCYQPWGTSTSYGDYYAYGKWNSNLNDQSGMADWGYNAISNGGNQENQWRTLAQSEWDYVLFTRNTTSGIRFAKATIREQLIDTVFLIDTILIDTVFNDVHGIVLLPDNWSESAYVLNDTNETGAPYETNIIMMDGMWEILEACGVVFLPAAGYRYGSSNVNYINSYGYYWSTTYSDSQYVYSMNIADNWVDSEGCFYRYFGRSVRLVCPAQ